MTVYSSIMGERGEGWVIAQGLVLRLFVLAPGASTPWPLGALWTLLGGLLTALGSLVLLLAVSGLGRNLSPFPRPVPDGQLVTSGLYALVRHPLYTGLMLVCLGVALWTNSPARLALSAVLLCLLDGKASREEAWLQERFLEYENYRRRVGKFFPGVY